MTPGICTYDPVNGEIISAGKFKNPSNDCRFAYDQHAKEFERLENFPETHLERHRPFWKTNTSRDDGEKEKPFKEVALILFIILPAGAIFLYLLIRALRECLLGCFY